MFDHFLPISFCRPPYPPNPLGPPVIVNHFLMVPCMSLKQPSSSGPPGDLSTNDGRGGEGGVGEGAVRSSLSRRQPAVLFACAHHFGTVRSKIKVILVPSARQHGLPQHGTPTKTPQDFKASFSSVAKHFSFQAIKHLKTRKVAPQLKYCCTSNRSS